MTHYELLKALRRAYKGRRSDVVHYVVKDNSELGYSMITEYMDLGNTDTAILSLKMITNRQDFMTFTRTEDGVKWVYDNCITKMMKLNSHKTSLTVIN